MLVLPFRQHNEPPEEASVHVCPDVAIVVVERPHSDRLLSDFKRVRPRLAGANLVGAAAVVALRAERPRTVRINPVAQAMKMEAVWRAVCVLDVDTQPLARLCVDDSARNAPGERRLIYVGSNKLVRLRDQVLWVKILSVDQRR